MSLQIREWFFANTTPEFRRSARTMYDLDTDFFIKFIKRAGVEFVLNKDLDIHLRYHGSVPSITLGKRTHSLSIEISQNKKPIDEEFFTIERTECY